MDLKKLSNEELLAVYHGGEELRAAVKKELRLRGVPLSAKRIKVNTVKQMIDFLKLCGFPRPDKSQSGCWEWHGHGFQLNGDSLGWFESPNEFFHVSRIVDNNPVEEAVYESFTDMVSNESRLNFSKALSKYAA